MLHSQNHMIDIGPKNATQRRAIAQGRLYAKADTLEKIRAKSLPKGDALAIAQIAGITTAKRTAELLPLCHPLPLDYVQVQCDVHDQFVLATCEVSAFAKTGVEMEALQGVMAALLCIYDIAKGVDKDLTISDISVVLKEGGRSGSELKAAVLEKTKKDSALQNYSAAVVTISDRCFQKKSEDNSGRFLVDKLICWGAYCKNHLVVPDEKLLIQSTLSKLALETKVDLIIATGGTGLGPRDVTVSALKQIITKAIPGIGELLRHEGSRQTPLAWLSQCHAGLIQNTLVISLPGSLKAVTEGMNALEPILEHTLHIINGGDHKGLS